MFLDLSSAACGNITCPRRVICDRVTALVGYICDGTIGLLQRRHVLMDLIKYIGKASNSLEDVESGLIHSAQNVYTEYPDTKRDEWQTKTLPALKIVPLTILEKMSGLSRRMITKVVLAESPPLSRLKPPSE